MFKEKPPLVRLLMQEYGTDVRRADDVDYWVKKWEESLPEISSKIVVDDVRFMNEAEKIRSLGGHLIRLERDIPIAGDLESQHISETEGFLIKEDFTIKTKEGEEELLFDELSKMKHKEK